MKMKNLICATCAAAAALITASASAGVEKYTFHDVVVGDMVIEIEASVKDNKKGSYSTCSYFSDDYRQWLGYYEAPVFAGDTPEEVRAHCLEHFDDRLGN